MSSNNPFLTIITPTYNRANLLKKCHASLLKQTRKDFEWIIADDGSTDDTEDAVKAFEASDFPVVYIKKENGGKHTALNAAQSHIRGRYVLILDSDDTLVETAVDDVYQQWSKFEDRAEIGIIIFLRGTSENTPFCTVKDFDTPVDILRYQRICFYGSDCCEVIRTELYKKYPFPEFEGEKFLSEGALWNRVALTHKCVYINKVIYLCEYLDGGLTKSGKALRIRNPLGGMYSSELCMHPSNYLNQRVKKGLLYCCYGFFAGLSSIEILAGAEHKLITAVCLLPGHALYEYWKRKYGN